ncbi:hypothetical protein ACT2CC_00795 [Candidatus Vidania fulgoroideorum]
MKYKIGEKLLIIKGNNKNIIAFLIKYKENNLFLKKNKKIIKTNISNVKIY